MARPTKTLADRVRSRSFIPSRHGDLLAGPLVGPERLRSIQRDWQAASSDAVRRALAVEYGKTLQGDGNVPARRGADVSLTVAKFFPAMFSHVKGAGGRQAVPA